MNAKRKRFSRRGTKEKTGCRRLEEAKQMNQTGVARHLPPVSSDVVDDGLFRSVARTSFLSSSPLSGSVVAPLARSSVLSSTWLLPSSHSRRSSTASTTPPPLSLPTPARLFPLSPPDACPRVAEGRRCRCSGAPPSSPPTPDDGGQEEEEEGADDDGGEEGDVSRQL